MRPPDEGLPSGIVSFVFTDIEGSTRLFYRLGEGYVAVLERHRRILREAWLSHRGHEISTEGDAFFVAFETADEAVMACATGQRGLASEEWPEDVNVRVRMGIHTGLATPHRGDYVAIAVYQASRVVAAGNGGQILVTQETAERVMSLNGLGLHPLGQYRLPDFDEPEPLYLVVGDDLPTDPAAVRALPADGHNLVRPPNPTIGREELIRRLGGELRAGRLLTLVGPGGVGKSRVAGEVGLSVAPAWRDGVWRVDLAALTELEQVEGAIAESVGTPSKPGGYTWDDTLEFLADRHVLIILDNCERLVAVCRELIGSLFAACPGVGVLATSREPVRLGGEVVWPVPPLPVTDTQAPDAALESPAVQLFVERGMAVRHGFVLDDHNAAVIVSICRHLDGLPLSLELAAANLAVLSSREILVGLEDRFRLLRGRGGSPDDRHHTMEGVLEWSYRMLDEEERQAFRRLSIFGTSFSLATATAAVAAHRLPPGEVPHLVWSLVDRSLASAELAADATRYRMLETIRAYGRDRLADEGETEEVALRVAHHLLGSVGPWHPADRGWLGDLGVELDNLRVLLGLVARDHPHVAQQMACSIGRYHDATHSFRAGIEELARYANSLTGPSSERVSLLATLADLHLRTGDAEAAARLVDDADALRKTYGMPDWDDVGVDRAQGEVARRSGDFARAAAIARAALERDLSDRGRSRMYNLLGTAAAAMEDLATAEEALTSELDFSRKSGHETGVTSALGNLAEVALRTGDLPKAAHYQRAALELATAQGSLPIVAFSLIAGARLAGASGAWDVAVQLHAKAEALLEEIGLVLYEDDRRESELLMSDARDALGSESFAAAVAEGNGLDMPEVIQLADAVLEEAEQGFRPDG